MDVFLEGGEAEFESVGLLAKRKATEFVVAYLFSTDVLDDPWPVDAPLFFFVAGAAEGAIHL